MCEFCGRVSCTLTKEQVLERGNVVEDNASGIMQTIEDEPESVNLTSKLFWRKLFNVNESAMFVFTK